MEKLFLGIQKHVVCLDKESGDKLWDTKVRSSTITNVHCEGEVVFAYAGGHSYCLQASDGSIKWENTLKGYGYGTCIIASQQQNSAIVSSQLAAQQAASVAGAAVTVTNNSGN